ncbi:ribonuclease H-like domain-containing protein [Tanacetum coccineum]
METETTTDPTSPQLSVLQQRHHLAANAKKTKMRKPLITAFSAIRSGWMVYVWRCKFEFLKKSTNCGHLVATMIRGQPGLDELDFDDLYNNLKVYEHELKGVSNSNSQNIAFLSTEVKGSTLKQSTAEPAHIPKGYTQAISSKVPTAPNCVSHSDEIICSFFAQQASMPTTHDDEDLLQIDEDAMEEIDIRWQESRANGRNEKRIVAIEDSNSKALVATDNNEDIDWTKEFDAEPVTYAMMALWFRLELNKMICSIELMQSTCTLYKGLDDFDWSNKADDAPVSLALMATNSESNKQRYVSDKSCIGFGIESSNSMESNISSGDETLTDSTYENFKREKAYKAVPPPTENKVIIEDWVDSDDEETDVSESQKETAFNSENSETSFENSPNHLIKDCNLHERTFQHTQTHKPKGTQGSRETRPVWNNIQRVNHSNFSRNSRSRVPQAVLSRSTDGSYYPRMDSRRPRISSYSPSSRSSTTRTPHRPQRPKKIVKSIWVKKGSTIGSQAVLPQTVKKSAMINPKQTWRPKGNYLDSVNRDNGSYTLKQFEYGNPEEDLKDYAIIDSGCSGSMTGDKDKLSDFKEFKGGYVAFGNDSKGGRISGKGTIKTSCLDFEKVSYVEELKFNLLSVSQICDKKHNVLFTDKECLILSPKFKFVDDDLHRASLAKRLKKDCQRTSLNCSTWTLFGTFSVAEYKQRKSTAWLRHKVKTIMCDHGTEFKNQLMNEFCAKKGIKREYSMQRTSQQNGVARKKNRTLIERLLELCCARPPSTYSIGLKQTIQLVMMLNREFWSTRKVQDCLHVNFLENQENQKGKGPDWISAYASRERTSCKEVQLSSEETSVYHDELVSLMHQESLAKAHNDDQRIAFEEEKRRISIAKGKEHVNSTFTLSTANTPPQSTGNTPTASDDDTSKDGPPGFEDPAHPNKSTELSRALMACIKPQEQNFKSLKRFPHLHAVQKEFLLDQLQEDVNILGRRLRGLLANAKKQTTCSYLSSTEAEYVAVAKLLCSTITNFGLQASLKVFHDVPHIRAKVACQERLLILRSNHTADYSLKMNKELIAFPKQVIGTCSRILATEVTANLSLKRTAEIQGLLTSKGLLDIYALNREVKRLKRQTLSQAKQIIKLKAKLKKLSKFVQPVVKHHAFWVENQNLKKQKRRRKKHKKKVSSVKLGRNKDEGTLSEEHYVQEEDTADPFFDDIADKDAAVTPDLERKSDETEEVNIEEKEASNVRSGDTEEIGLETTQSTARQDQLKALKFLFSILDQEFEHSWSYKLQPRTATQGTDPKEIKQKGYCVLKNLKEEITSQQIRALETTKMREVAKEKFKSVMGCRRRKKELLNELKKTKPKTT